MPAMKRLFMVLTLALAGGSAFAQNEAPRGALLYDNHCIACHSTQMHWRDQRLAKDWASLRALVRRWQGAAQLNWSEEEVDDVARYLNARFYRLPEPGAKS